MKFKLLFASDCYKRTKDIEINTMEELKKLSEHYDEQLIINFNDWGVDFITTKSERYASITIYDDYIE